MFYFPLSLFFNRDSTKLWNTYTYLVTPYTYIKLMDTAVCRNSSFQSWWNDSYITWVFFAVVRIFKIRERICFFQDITQQQLCNVEVVALIEKCARFHIYCAERLCEESMMNFDPRINNENLTKCMQTLKHFYYDLGIKGIKCPCEAEFRAYDILLNLNRGGILR